MISLGINNTPAKEIWRALPVDLKSGYKLKVLEEKRAPGKWTIGYRNDFKVFQIMTSMPKLQNYSKGEGVVHENKLFDRRIPNLFKRGLIWNMKENKKYKDKALR